MTDTDTDIRPNFFELNFDALRREAVELRAENKRLRECLIWLRDTDPESVDFVCEKTGINLTARNDT